jgi:outer membrane protein OmpA-like peptidoglycan-associated protein
MAPVLWLLVSLAFAGVDDRVDRLSARDPIKARDVAEDWLDKHETHKRRPDVFAALGRAIFAQGVWVDTVVGWQRTKADLRPWPELEAEAFEREAAAAWRDAGASRDVTRLRGLLTSYPTSRVAPPIRERLAGVERERAGSDTGKLRAVHREFIAFPETRTVALDALGAAKQLDFDRAATSGNLNLWLTWRALYAGNGVKVSLDASALTLEQDLVFVVHTTPEALLAERDRFADVAWRQRVEAQAAQRALEALWRDDFQDVRGWLARYRDLAGLQAVAERMPSAMSERLAELDTVDAWRAYAVIFPRGPFGAVAEARAIDAALRQALADDTPEALLAFAKDFPDHPSAMTLRQRAYDLAWAWAEEDGTSEAYAQFLADYPDDPRAWQAEARHLLLVEEAPYPRADVTKVRSLADGLQEYTVEVRGCDEQRIGGLVQSDFGVWDGMREASIAAFSNNESDRPLDIVIGLDLSGSMSEEQEAVREAIRSFSSQMTFRSRPFRVGLAGFSDAFEAMHRLSASPTDLERWIDDLPPSFGGAAEDSVGAGYVASDWLANSGAERVFILMTDEPLQWNTYGYQRSVAAQDPVCDPYQTAATCIDRCSGETRCESQCLATAPRGLAQWLQGCTPEQGTWACREQAQAWLADRWMACGGRYGDAAVKRLAATLRRHEIRAFVLGPATAREPDYANLAYGTGGRWLDVPDASRSSEPYEAALLDIADELSRQYTLQARVFQGPTPQIRAPNARRWLSIGPSPMPALAAPTPPSAGAVAGPSGPTPPVSSAIPVGAGLTAVPPFTQTLDVPDRDGVVVASDGTGNVWRSLDRGQTWRIVDAGRGTARVLSAAGPWLCASDAAGLRCATDGGRRWAALGQPYATSGYGVIVAHGAQTLLLQGGAQHQLVAVYNRDIATSAVYFPTNVDQFDASLLPHLEALARQAGADRSLLVQVDGHADQRGDVDKNEDLARRRAQNVANALRSMGVPPGQLLVRSFGERAPIRSGASSTDLAANRRVELTVLRPLGASACDGDEAERIEQPLPLEELGLREAPTPEPPASEALGQQPLPVGLAR